MFLRNDHYDRGFLFASYGGQCFVISLFFFKEVSIHWFTKRSVLEVSRKHACVCKHATIVGLLENLTRNIQITREWSGEGWIQSSDFINRQTIARVFFCKIAPF